MIKNIGTTRVLPMRVAYHKDTTPEGNRLGERLITGSFTRSGLTIRCGRHIINPATTNPREGGV